MRSSFIVCVSGYTQTRGYFHGILNLREALIKKGYSHGPAHRVEYLTWQTNYHRVASDLSIICGRHGLVPHIVLAGYSYGGWGAIQLASELEHKGIDVDAMILSDAVGRPWFWPRPLPAVSSLLGRSYASKLHIPHNVKKLVSFYQKENRPQGHQLICKNGTKVTAPVQLFRPHALMDDAKEFHSSVMEESELVYQATLTEEP